MRRLLVILATASMLITISLSGDVIPASAATVDYYLPYEGGTTEVLTQGPGDCNPSHCSGSNSAYAYDFGLALNDPVWASAPGTLYYRNSSHTDFGNVVIIEHNDGYCTIYAHLNTIASDVVNGSVGSMVIEQGHKLGGAGETGGWTDGVHLHFGRAVCSTWATVSMEFVENNWTSQNPGTGGSVPPDMSPDLLFYRTTDGAHNVYNVDSDGDLSSLYAGTGWINSWDSIVEVEIDGDADSEVLLYRSSDGKYAYVDVANDGTVSTLVSGDWGSNWRITAVEADGDVRSELLFYRTTDGAHRIYNINANGSLVGTYHSGSGWITTWDQIIPLQLNNNERSEILLYRQSDGKYAYFKITNSGNLSSVSSGDWGSNWVIHPVQVDNDNRSELFFYRTTDGAHKVYEITSNGVLNGALYSGTGWINSWDSITPLEIDGDAQPELLLYRTSDGKYAYANIASDGTVTTLTSGDWGSNWVIRAVEIGGG